MGKLRAVEPVKLFTGLIAVSKDIISQTEEHLIKKWGRIETASPVINFDYTDYYSNEMGKELLRKWISFEKTVDPGELASIKQYTNKIECELSLGDNRKVNIDPGYLALSKVVLASTKDFSHRIYLSDGIYAELTLIYNTDKYAGLRWSYPDYQSKTASDFLLLTRKKYYAQLFPVKDKK